MKWSPNGTDELASGVTGIRSFTDGYTATSNLISARESRLSDYPPFEWIFQKNGNGQGVWYLPSVTELQYLLCAATGNAPETWGYWTGSGRESGYPSFNPNGGSVLDLSNLNDKLGAADGTGLDQRWYWSSTEDTSERRLVHPPSMAT